MDKEQKVVARTKLATVRTKLSEASVWIGEGDSLRAFQAAEEAYMAAWEAKDYLDRINQKAWAAKAEVDAGREAREELIGGSGSNA